MANKLRGLIPGPDAEPKPQAEPKAAESKRDKRPNPIGVYLEWEDLDDLASIVQDTGLKRGSVLTYAVQYFLRKYKAGEVETEPKRGLKMP